jgi:hypothetical protein
MEETICLNQQLPVIMHLFVHGELMKTEISNSENLLETSIKMQQLQERFASPKSKKSSQ